MKKATAIKILILLILIAVGVISYYFFFQNNQESTREVVSPEQPNSNFFPDSENFNQGTTDQPQNNDQRPNRDLQDITSLRQISENPTAGFIIFDETSTTTNELVNNTGDGDEEVVIEEVVDSKTVYRFVNKSNGNIFETDSKTSSINRITNKTIPKIQDSIFSKDGNNVIFRYLDNSNRIESVFLKLMDNKSSTTTDDTSENTNSFKELETNFLPKNITNLDINNEDVLYTLETNNGLNGFVFNVDSILDQTLSFGSKLSQVDVKWLNENSVLIGTKPSNSSNGLLFQYNLETKQTNKIIESRIGFNFLPNKNSNFIVYSELSGDSINSYSYNIETNETIDLNLNTIVSDKCAWSNVEDTIIYCAVPNNQIGFGYPNTWYQGQVSFNDSLYQIDVESDLKIKIDGLEGDFDIINPQVSNNDEYITFVNKKDLTLWSLDIK